MKHKFCECIPYHIETGGFYIICITVCVLFIIQPWFNDHREDHYILVLQKYKLLVSFPFCIIDIRFTNISISFEISIYDNHTTILVVPFD